MNYNKLAIGVASALGLLVAQVMAEEAQEVETKGDAKVIKYSYSEIKEERSLS